MSGSWWGKWEGVAEFLLATGINPMYFFLGKIRILVGSGPGWEVPLHS